MTRPRPLLALCASLLLPACASQAAPPTLEARELGTTRNVHAFGDTWTAGQPSTEDLAAARDAGFKTVVNSRHLDEKGAFDELRLVGDLGMTFVALPWNGPDELTDEVFDRSRELLESAERPMLFHCASANRIGAVWIPWRVLDGGLDYADALAEAREIGLRTEAYEAKAADYVRRHAR